ncbi:citrate lyase beta chain [Cryobacterium roopkundense]|uniref:Citrate lyase beta chain n=1 Tax=Cryobacterium roopkundense TaxID=1001240 RepID=A0A099JPL7_9MICO|nr:CoA ester lyase [Cryobacterium roopkundense]KGJ79403.1 citrate lyase beta chain [Cryobacterium roopkundense]MBB5639878.1 citrate lyase subunit beta/citryl-CoA lyase [Cryobacterium roopkundense]
MYTTAITALFVPGDRPERFRKAIASAADVVIIDLEDAVAPEAKADALAAILQHLAPGPDTVHALVRVNAERSATLAAELAALRDLAARPGHGLLGLVVPKAENPELLREISAKFTGLALVALIESALGVQNAPELARVPGVTRLAFGAIDYALDIDAGPGDRVLDYARSAIVVASRAAGLEGPLDSPSVQIRDAGVVAESAALARQFGFGGKLCIHPAQLEPVAAAFRPTPAEVEWAHSVIGATGGAAQVDGQMIDRPVMLRAERILARCVPVPVPVPA